MPTLLGETRAGDTNLTTRGGMPVFEANYHYLVLADSLTQSRHEIVFTDGLPVVGPGGTTIAGGFAVCKSMNATRREANALYWDVTATFSSEVEEGSGAPPGEGFNSDPVTWVPVYETKFERMQQVVAKDKAGDPVANSASQPFEVGLQIGRFIPVWEFFQFEADTVTDEQIVDRNEVVNATTFKGRPQHTLLLTVQESVIWQFFNRRIRLTKYELRYNELNWKHKRLDVGTQYIDAGVLKDFVSADGSPMLGALDGVGGQQAVGTPPAVLEFEIYDEVEFSNFIRF